jgi:hypothetical protein
MKFKLAMNAEAKLWVERMLEQQVFLQHHLPFSKLQDRKTKMTGILVV